MVCLNLEALNRRDLGLVALVGTCGTAAHCRFAAAVAAAVAVAVAVAATAAQKDPCIVLHFAAMGWRVVCKDKPVLLLLFLLLLLLLLLLVALLLLLLLLSLLLLLLLLLLLVLLLPLLCLQESGAVAAVDNKVPGNTTCL